MTKPISLPLINVRDVVLFPKMQMNLWIGRKFTFDAISYAKKNNKGRMIAITQKSAEKNDPIRKSDMYSIGIECKLIKSVAFPDESMKILVEGIQPVRISRVFDNENVRFAEGNAIKWSVSKKIADRDKAEIIDLIVRGNPGIAVNDELSRLKELLKEADLVKFLGQAILLSSLPQTPVHVGKKKRPQPQAKRTLRIDPRKAAANNKEILKRQRILEEKSSAKQLKMMKKILFERVISSINRMKVS